MLLLQTQSHITHYAFRLTRSDHLAHWNAHNLHTIRKSVGTSRVCLCRTARRWDHKKPGDKAMHPKTWPISHIKAAAVTGATGHLHSCPGSDSAGNTDSSNQHRSLCGRHKFWWKDGVGTMHHPAATPSARLPSDYRQSPGTVRVIIVSDQSGACTHIHTAHFRKPDDQ